MWPSRDKTAYAVLRAVQRSGRSTAHRTAQRRKNYAVAASDVDRRSSRSKTMRTSLLVVLPHSMGSNGRRILDLLLGRKKQNKQKKKKKGKVWRRRRRRRRVDLNILLVEIFLWLVIVVVGSRCWSISDDHPSVDLILIFDEISSISFD